MAVKSLWVASVKAKVLENCELDNDGSEFQYVEIFLLTQDSNVLLEQTKAQLAQMGLEFNDLLKLDEYKSEEWIGKDNDPLMIELLEEAAEQARSTEQLTFGPFTTSRYYE